MIKYKTVQVLYLIFAMLLVGQVVNAEEQVMTPKDYLSGAHIKVTQDGTLWNITGTKRTVVLNANDLSISIQSAGVTWPLKGSEAEDIIVANGTERFGLSLKSAANIAVSNYDTGTMSGIKIDLSGFKKGNTALDLKLQLFVCVEGNGEDVIFKAIATEGTCLVKELRWPGGLEAGFADRSIVPLMQGAIIPKNYPRKVWAYERLTHSRALYMPWWGFEKNGTAAAVILETPDDAGMDLTHPAGGPTFIRPVWVHSLGKLSYPRSIRMGFAEKGNYVDLCKIYRKYMIDRGKFVSLKEKIARSPLVAKLIGAPVVHTPTKWHCEPESIYFDKQNPKNNDTVTTFDETASMLEKLYKKGIKRAYLHLDGWGYAGYDNQHPDIIPPAPEAGGWEGMKRLGDVCEKLGYIFAIHDQYRDYYTRTSSYSDRHAISDENGNTIKMAIWPGGDQGLLCASLAPEAVRRNDQALVDHGVKVKGAYLDVYAIVTPDECYNPEHPMTRTQCLQFQSQCFGAVRSLLGIVSSEEPTDGSIPDLDIVHHGPYALDPNPGAGPSMGIAAPLFSLVYHDAIVLPWSASPGKGGWGIPDNDMGYIHALLNAGIPYVSMNPDKNEMTRLKTLCALHRRVALLEMTNHEFLDAGMRKQRTTYSDGTKVTVDFDSGDFKIEPELSKSELRNALSK